MPLLQVSNLTKNYGKNRGVFGVDFEINPGEIVGFIGPNGAGKTTTMLALTGFIGIDEGSISMFDTLITRNTVFQNMDELGVLFSDISYPNSATPAELFNYREKLLGKDLEYSWEQLSHDFQLPIHTPIKKLSLGNRKKIGVILSIFHNPKLVIADEPTSGLDPVIQQHYLHQLKDIKKQGGSVLLSSHVLSEVQSICDRVLIIKEGRIILHDTTESIMEQANKVFHIHHCPAEVIQEIEQTHIVSIQKHTHETIVYTVDIEPIIKLLVYKNIYSFTVEKPSLEEMFMKYYK